MESSASLGVVIAFTAGLLSFLSPCVLPLIPSYVTFITGMSLEEVQGARRTALVHALLFVTGFTLIFLLLGATATMLGRVFLAYRDWISRAGGVLMILFGLYLLGIARIRAFDMERRVHLADKPVGYVGTLVVGIAFGAGWTPCIGPILGSILTYASSTADWHRGVLLLFAYSLGLAVPFLIAALAIDKFMSAFRKYRGGMIWANRIGGVLLIAVGLLLITGSFTLLAAWLSRMTPDALRSRI
ncbi:MAG: cytochrome c biogenesis protein CcdA [Gemmatimonadaceae bacterium]